MTLAAPCRGDMRGGDLGQPLYINSYRFDWYAETITNIYTFSIAFDFRRNNMIIQFEAMLSVICYIFLKIANNFFPHSQRKHLQKEKLT